MKGRFSITNWRHVIAFSAAITLLSVLVPVTVVSIALWHVPLHRQLQALAIAGAIPLFIAFPVSVFALNLLRVMNTMMAKMDDVMRYDGLTGVLNRTQFFNLVAAQRRADALFMIADADHFKKINDTWGHDCGDQVLKLLAQTLNGVFGTYGLIGRLGGEEFAIYLPQVSPEQVRLLTATLRTKLRAEQFEYNGSNVQVTLSIGGARDDLRQSITDTSKLADSCLYTAKKAGRDCSFVADQSGKAVLLAS